MAGREVRHRKGGHMSDDRLIRSTDGHWRFTERIAAIDDM